MQQSKIRSPRATRRRQVERPKSGQARMLERRRTATCQEQNRTKTFPVPEDAYYMAGAGGQYAIIIPTHDLIVVRLGHYKGQPEGEKALRRALALLMEAVPQTRPVWQPEMRHD